MGDATYESPIARWFLSGANGAGYEAAEGHLRSRAPGTSRFGTLMTQHPTSAAPFADWLGKRIRFRAEVRAAKVEGWAGLWMRVDGPAGPDKQRTILAFDNMQSRAIVGDADWALHDVVLDVEPNARTVTFGLILEGDGEVWIRNATLEPVGNDIHVTHPNDLAEGWIFEDNLAAFLTALGWIVEYELGADDLEAIASGVKDTDHEANRWYAYPLVANASRVELARDVGSSVTFVRVGAPRWLRREVLLAIEIFSNFSVR